MKVFRNREDLIAQLIAKQEELYKEWWLYRLNMLNAAELQRFAHLHTRINAIMKLHLKLRLNPR